MLPCSNLISNINLWHEHECANWAACQCKAYLLVLMYTALKASCSCDMSNKPFTVPITPCTCHIHACNSVVIVFALGCCRYSSSAGWALLMLHLKSMTSIGCAQISAGKTTVIHTAKAPHMGHCFGTATCKQVQWTAHVNIPQKDTSSSFGDWLPCARNHTQPAETRAANKACKTAVHNTTLHLYECSAVMH
jgi:hypothetical protein